MSAATRAKTAKERATIAIQMIKHTANKGRAFDDCFEMGDGDAVVTEIIRRAEKDDTLRAKMLTVFDRFVLERLGYKETPAEAHGEVLKMAREMAFTLESSLRPTYSPLPGQIQGLINRALAAIAKAEGRTVA